MHTADRRCAQVLFVHPSKAALHRMVPQLSAGGAAQTTLARIAVRYVPDAAALRVLCGAVQMLPAPPSVVLVDQLERLAPGVLAGGPEAARTCALMHSAATWLGGRHGRPVRWVCVHEGGDGGSRWLPGAMHVTVQVRPCCAHVGLTCGQGGGAFRVSGAGGELLYTVVDGAVVAS